ncbi:MAG: hypothetical protein KF688_05635 [Pirellulales bacterium]|nr:hypothetical protein [Pirellulales bacterium]
MPRFVLLRHVTPPDSPRASHWDFMVERGAALATWAVEELPSAWRRGLGEDATAEAEAVRALRLPDHRLAYLEYEGPVSDDRGVVSRTDAGACTVLQWSERSVLLLLAGERLVGRVALQLAEDGHWSLRAE